MELIQILLPYATQIKTNKEDELERVERDLKSLLRRQQTQQVGGKNQISLSLNTLTIKITKRRQRKLRGRKRYLGPGRIKCFASIA
jgi:hypothetical protein